VLGRLLGVSAGGLLGTIVRIVLLVCSNVYKQCCPCCEAHGFDWASLTSNSSFLGQLVHQLQGSRAYNTVSTGVVVTLRAQCLLVLLSHFGSQEQMTYLCKSLSLALLSSADSKEY
jgi:hypothetical protein